VISNATFNTSAKSIQDSPSPDISEVVFIGRSNVGKSSLLNTLTRRKNLAKSSSTPGKTQLINFFDITFKKNSDNFGVRFVDLPGFGYAKVSKSLKKDWGDNLTNFLYKRSSIRVFIHLIDSRHPNLKIDQEVSEFLKEIKKPDQIVIEVATKVDKLKQKELSALKRAKGSIISVSNMKKTGVKELEESIFQYIFGESLYED
jgi:GTP-binding protein